MTTGLMVPGRNVRIIPVNEASWDDLRDIFGATDQGRRQCRQIFEDAGFEEVSRPTVRRVVMRIDVMP